MINTRLFLTVSYLTYKCCFNAHSFTSKSNFKDLTGYKAIVYSLYNAVDWKCESYSTGCIMVLKSNFKHEF